MKAARGLFSLSPTLLSPQSRPSPASAICPNLVTGDRVAQLNHQIDNLEEKKVDSLQTNPQKRVIV